MDYVIELSRIRDLMHREIIRTMITDNRNHFDYVLEFKYPLECIVQNTRPTLRPERDHVILTGIDSNTNELVARSPEGEERTVFYSDLRLEDLATVHRAIISKNYTLDFSGVS